MIAMSIDIGDQFRATTNLAKSQPAAQEYETKTSRIRKCVKSSVVYPKIGCR